MLWNRSASMALRTVSGCTPSWWAMDRLLLVVRGDRQHHDQIGGTMVELVHGNHECRACSRLLAAYRRVEMDRPDIAAAGFGRAHSSFSPSASVLSQSARSASSAFHALGSFRRAA